MTNKSWRWRQKPISEEVAQSTVWRSIVAGSGTSWPSPVRISNVCFGCEVRTRVSWNRLTRPVTLKASFCGSWWDYMQCSLGYVSSVCLWSKQECSAAPTRCSCPVFGVWLVTNHCRWRRWGRWVTLATDGAGPASSVHSSQTCKSVFNTRRTSRGC